MAQRVVFTGKQQVSVAAFELGPVGAGQVRVRSELSLMSTGTENIVLNRLFDAGTHWDNWVKYPFYPGYATVGRIEEVGPAVQGLGVGDRVATRGSHASAHVRPASGVYPVPDDLESGHAAWFALARIAGAGVRVGELVMGDSVLVIGAGPVGQMAVRWAVASGAESVIAADPVAARLALARRGGATGAVETADAAAAGAEVLAANFGRPPRVVIDSTGHPAVFAIALAAAADRGTVVVLGDTGSPSGQRLTTDVIMRGVRVVGAHDSHPWPGRTEAEVYRLFFGLLAAGRMNLDGMNTHAFAGADAPAAYREANARRGETMGIVFDWTAAQ